MSDFISPILQWINTHPQFALFAVFLISAAESIAIIGTIVPGSVMMTAIGTLIGAGVMPLWSTLIWAILGAIAGDGVSYWLGYYFKGRLRDIWPFRNYPYLLDSGIRFIQKHGGKSVFIGRFVGPVRALVPLVAGMLHMKPLKFMISNVASAIGWAPAYLLPGIAMGVASLELPPDIAVHAILMLLLVGLFIILCFWMIQKLFRLIGNRINHGLTYVWQRLRLSRYFSIITLALKHHHPHKAYGQLILAFYLIITVILLLNLSFYVHAEGSSTLFINSGFFHLFRSLRSPTIDNVMIGLTLLGESKVVLSVLSVLFIWFLSKKRWHTAWHILALGLMSVISIEFFKHHVHSDRPWGIAQSPSGFSFVSGHTTFAFILYVGFALLIVKANKQKYRDFFYILAAILVGCVGISRVYLGAHWLTDIIGSVLLGSCLLMLTVLSYNRQAEKNINPVSLFVVMLTALTISYSVCFYFYYPKLKHNSVQLEWPVYQIKLQAWWNQQGDHLPFYRINRFGLSPQILNLQWLDNLEHIKQQLIQNGWEVPPERNWISILHRLSDVQSAEHLPLVSPLYLDQEPVLILIKHANGNKKLVVLRLWNSHALLENTKFHLWVGTVELVPRTYSWLFKHTRANELQLKSNLIFSEKPKNYIIKEITVTNYHRRKPEKQVMVLIKSKL